MGNLKKKWVTLKYAFLYPKRHLIISKEISDEILEIFVNPYK